MPSNESFNINFTDSPDIFIKQAFAIVHENGGKISGDSSCGNFSVSISILGKVDGVYEIRNQSCKILISQRPFLISCSKIENFVKSKL